MRAEWVATCSSGGSLSVLTIAATKVPVAPKNMVRKVENAPPAKTWWRPMAGSLPSTDQTMKAAIANCTTQGGIWMKRTPPRAAPSREPKVKGRIIVV